MLRPDRKPHRTPARSTFIHSLVERLQALPDLGNVTAASAVPGEGYGTSVQLVRTEGGEPSDSERRVSLVSRVSVVPGYFDAMGLTLAAGRDFSLADGGASGDVAIVDDVFALRYWPGSDPIGQRFRFGGVRCTTGAPKRRRTRRPGPTSMFRIRRRATWKCRSCREAADRSKAVSRFCVRSSRDSTPTFP